MEGAKGQHRANRQRNSDLQVGRKKFSVVDVTDKKQNSAVKDGNNTVEDVFPELLYNRIGVVLRGYRSREIGKERTKKLAAALHCDYRLFL